jgi:signal peptidase II
MSSLPATTVEIANRDILKRSLELRHWAVLVGLAASFYTVDQITKWLVRQNLAVGEQWAPIPALAKVFTFTHVRNTGVAFGQMPGLGWLFMLANLIVAVGILYYYPRMLAGEWQLRLASGLILAGDFGNLTDRLRTAFLASGSLSGLWAALPQAYVTDFVDIKIWPVWNVADMCVVSGVAILAWMLWRFESLEGAERAEEAVQQDQ